MKRNQGISLIVLIITIVVIVILAAAIILNMSNTNIIENANEAVVKQDFKTLQEELDMYVAQEYIYKEGVLDITTVDALTKEAVEEIIPSITKTNYADYVTIVDGKIAISDEMPEPQKTWAMEALGLISTSNNKPTKPETPVVPDTPDEPQQPSNVALDNTQGTKNKFIIGEQGSYNNPVIPVGFKAINTTEASWEEENGVVKGWNDGLVIQDNDLNEFVWVPCTTNGANGTIAYTKRFDSYSKADAITSVVDDTQALPMKDAITQVNEIDQITTYGGFYIGRYEAGVPANQTAIDGLGMSTSNKPGIPVVQREAKVWTSIAYDNAIPNAKSLYQNNTHVRSGLVTGTAWDTLCAWIESVKDSSGNTIYNVSSNSSSWGNYSDSSSPADVNGFGTKKTAGFSEYWKAKNIYDVAGNVWEWTGETLPKENPDDNEEKPDAIIRSGRCNLTGGSRPAAYRISYVASNYTGVNGGFRILLYVL